VSQGERYGGDASMGPPFGRQVELIVSVKPHLTCCLCDKLIPQAQDVLALDGEWRRRYPSMRGILACGCALRTEWSCLKPGGREFVDGHIPAPADQQGQDFDSWSHILAEGTHRAMVMKYPRSGLLQGAEPYLRWSAARKGIDSKVAEQLRAVLQDWDAGLAPADSAMVAHS